MESDRLNEKKAQEILDRLDKDEFVFSMNDLEGEEYVSFQKQCYNYFIKIIFNKNFNDINDINFYYIV